MSSASVISVQNVSKAYRIWATPAQRLVGPACAQLGNILPGALGSSLKRQAQAGYRDFFALQDISFEVQRGEAVAIVGRNGAGKSTLLQLIASTLQPSTGSVRLQGRVTALLELGAGFNPDFTGRENAFLSGAVLGLGQKEMAARFDEIAAFADIGDFIEQPVKTYSSGMMMRLAFAVNTCVDPDILIVDEALSVGDAPFQAKCFRRLRQLIDKGVSLLFVSHDIGTVRSVCSRALWLKNGRAEMWGEAKAVAKEYEKFCWQEQGVVMTSATAPERPSPYIPRPGNETGPIPAWLHENRDAFNRSATADRYGTGEVHIVNFGFCPLEGAAPGSHFDYDEEVYAWYLLKINSPVNSDFMVGLRFFDTKGNAVLAVQDLKKINRLAGEPGQLFGVRVALRLPLHHTDYTVRISVFGFKTGARGRGSSYDFGDAVVWDVIENAGVISIRPYAEFPLGGPVHLHGDTDIHELPRS